MYACLYVCTCVRAYVCLCLYVLVNGSNWHQWPSLGIVKSMKYPWNTMKHVLVALHGPALQGSQHGHGCHIKLKQILTYFVGMDYDVSWCINVSWSFMMYLLLACWPFKGAKRRRHIHGGTLPRVACWISAGATYKYNRRCRHRYGNQSLVMPSWNHFRPNQQRINEKATRKIHM